MAMCVDNAALGVKDSISTHREMCPVIYWIYQATRLLAGDLFCPVAQPVAW